MRVYCQPMNRIILLSSFLAGYRVTMAARTHTEPWYLLIFRPDTANRITVPKLDCLVVLVVLISPQMSEIALLYVCKCLGILLIGFVL